MPSCSVIWKPMSSTVPRAKLSTLNAAGTRRMRAISCAAAYSGLMIMSRPISRRRIGASRKYSGLRTRATVCLAPSFFAINEQTRFTSSSAVAAMTRSASRTPARSSTLAHAPLPSTHMASSVASACSITAALSSTKIRSCSSPTICWAMA